MEKEERGGEEGSLVNPGAPARECKRVYKGALVLEIDVRVRVGGLMVAKGEKRDG